MLRYVLTRFTTMLLVLLVVSVALFGALYLQRRAVAPVRAGE